MHMERGGLDHTRVRRVQLQHEPHIKLSHQRAEHIHTTVNHKRVRRMEHGRGVTPSHLLLQQQQEHVMPLLHPPAEHTDPQAKHKVVSQTEHLREHIRLHHPHRQQRALAIRHRLLRAVAHV